MGDRLNTNQSKIRLNNNNNNNNNIHLLCAHQRTERSHDNINLNILFYTRIGQLVETCQSPSAHIRIQGYT